LWNGADSLGDYVGGFLRVTILTGKRKTAVAEMRREDIDADGVWRHPEAVDPMAKRGKKRNKRIHVCPLPKAAQEITGEILPQLDDKDRANPYLFPGRIKDSPLVPGTSVQKMVAKVSEIPDFYFHALRHTVETRLAKLGVSTHIRDMVLDHTPQRGAGAGYDHPDYYNEMRHALDTWAAELADIVAGKKDEKVVPLKKA
jgi:integrase